MNKLHEQSAAIRLLDLVWENANQGVSHSWERLNHAMRGALSMAIGSGFTFALADLEAISGKYSFGYWCSDSVEWIYSEAVAVENMSAVKSFEAWQKREPFIADEVTFCSSGGFTHGNYMTRQRERLTVGAKFKWKSAAVTVTSFADDNSYLTACSYKPRKKGEYGDKIEKRFKITRYEIITERAERKERAELLARLTAACNGSAEVAGTITKALGTKRADDFAAIPLDKVRKIADQYAPMQPKPPSGTVITKAHRAAAREAGACARSLKRYPVGAPLESLSHEDRLWVMGHLPDLYAKHFAKDEAA